jgi:hypothetical protein
MRKEKTRIGSTVIKIAMATLAVLAVATVVILSREVQPTVQQVTKTLDSSRLQGE